MRTVEPKARLIALRNRLGMTQEDMEIVTSGRLKREEISNCERGKNKMTTHRIRELLAQALKVDEMAFADYIGGRMSIDALLEHREARSERGADSAYARSRKLGDRDDWPEAVKVVRGKHAYIPVEFFERAAITVDYDALPHPTNPEHVLIIARGLWDAWRDFQKPDPEPVSAHTEKIESSKQNSKKR